MGGMLVALQALMAYKRANALEAAAEAQTIAAEAQAKATKVQAVAVRKTGEGQRQDRLKHAIEHLGHNSDSVRMGGACELFLLAQDSEELRQAVRDILCAHIRQITGGKEYRERHTKTPSEEVQSILNLLQMREVFSSICMDLTGSWLNGVQLVKADLKYAKLSGTYLQGATLDKASLRRTLLYDTQMQGASFVETIMTGSHLQRTKLRGASLANAVLTCADLTGAQLQGAFVGGVQLQGANLEKTDFSGATSKELKIGSFESPFDTRIKGSIDKSGDLSAVAFEGGLDEHKVELFVKGLSEEDAKKLQDELKTHCNKKVSHQPPKGVVFDFYSEDLAKTYKKEYLA